MSDMVAAWDVPLSDKVHRIEFEHGTTTGKRVIRVDGKEIIRKEWMFKLVGSEIFTIGDGIARCEIMILPSSGFEYEYTLFVDGKQLQKFKENQSKILKTWAFNYKGMPFRIVLEQETLDVWMNGKKMDTKGEFVESGTEIYLTEKSGPFEDIFIRTVSSGNRKEGIIYSLFVDGQQVPENHE